MDVLVDSAPGAATDVEVLGHEVADDLVGNIGTETHEAILDRDVGLVSHLDQFVLGVFDLDDLGQDEFGSDELVQVAFGSDDLGQDEFGLDAFGSDELGQVALDLDDVGPDILGLDDSALDAFGLDNLVPDLFRLDDLAPDDTALGVDPGDIVDGPVVGTADTVHLDQRDARNWEQEHHHDQQDDLGSEEDSKKYKMLNINYNFSLIIQSLKNYLFMYHVIRIRRNLEIKNRLY